MANRACEKVGTAAQEGVLGKTQSDESIRSDLKRGSKTISFFGHFGLDNSGNFGNEITFRAALYHLRHVLPNVKIICICTDPVTTAKTYKIKGVPISRSTVRAWEPRNRLERVLRSCVIGVPSEVYRWFEALITLKHTDVLIIPGTGLLTDAFSLRSWGPYSLLKWSVIAKVCGCKLFFISVGAGPIDSPIGRWLVRSALALADFRSFRDDATKAYLNSIGAAASSDPVYPDLAFSFVNEVAPNEMTITGRRRPLVGLGLMLHHGRLSSDRHRDSTYASYLDQLVIFAKWLLARDYDIRLLIGDFCDRRVIDDFKSLLKNRLVVYDENRIMDNPVTSVEELLGQLAETDAVVATRFHNILLALALNKPVISISFHQKCTSLMQDMGLQEYLQDIRELRADKLIEQFHRLEKNAGTIRQMIKEKVSERREALDEQYALIFGALSLQ